MNMNISKFSTPFPYKVPYYFPIQFNVIFQLIYFFIYPPHIKYFCRHNNEIFIMKVTLMNKRSLQLLQ